MTIFDARKNRIKLKFRHFFILKTAQSILNRNSDHFPFWLFYKYSVFIHVQITLKIFLSILIKSFNFHKQNTRTRYMIETVTIHGAVLFVLRVVFFSLNFFFITFLLLFSSKCLVSINATDRFAVLIFTLRQVHCT